MNIVKCSVSTNREDFFVHFYINAQGCPYDGPQLEMWSVGVLLYIIIFGENPFYDPQVSGGGSMAATVSGNVRTIVMASTVTEPGLAISGR